VFFTCLCPPCKSVALALASKSGRVALISYKPKSEVEDFVTATGWRGPVYLDPGSRMAIACGVFECPRLVRASGEGALAEMSLSDAPREWGGSTR
jgi:hypothetical protein